jgi:hypothetical protein
VDNGGVKGGVAAPGNLQGGDAAKWRGLEEAVGAAGGGDCGSEKHWEDFFYFDPFLSRNESRQKKF